MCSARGIVGEKQTERSVVVPVLPSEDGSRYGIALLSPFNKKLEFRNPAQEGRVAVVGLCIEECTETEILPKGEVCDNKT